ncbi:MAG: hypothetical protein COB46_00165 [Rhodospirillaceae bacterium]|nr:MAG: hypothetical protein COB46_00165 [Rhodospirillaceae bacterium]
MPNTSNTALNNVRDNTHDNAVKHNLTANLDLSDLPGPATQRWDSKRKAQVVEAVRTGRLSLEQACEVYSMSVDELSSWQRLLDRHGAKGLMATRTKEYRMQQYNRR